MSSPIVKNRVNLFIPCCMDMFQPATAGSVISVLERLGDECLYHETQTCCGRRFYFEGEIESAKSLGEKLMNEFLPSSPKELKEFSPIVIPSAACVGFIKNYYKILLENRKTSADLKTISQNVYELCYYIVNIKKVTCLNNTFSHRVYYFKSCSARNFYYLDDEPEILLRNTKGLDLITSPDFNKCCSANGRFAIANPEDSDRMLEDIVNEMYKAGTQYVTSTDLHCLQYIDAFVKSKGIGLEVIHIADILNGEQ